MMSWARAMASGRNSMGSVGETPGKRIDAAVSASCSACWHMPSLCDS
jgi:hypothetical protein